MNESVWDEIPDTEQGLKDYIRYAENQIKKNLLLNMRLKTRMVRCNERLDTIQESKDGA